MKTAMQKEPAVTVATITAFVTAIIGLLVAFGLNISQEQQDAVLGVIGPSFVVILALGPIVRQFVSSPETVKQEKLEAFHEGVEVAQPTEMTPPKPRTTIPKEDGVRFLTRPGV